MRAWTLDGLQATAAGNLNRTRQSPLPGFASYWKACSPSSVWALRESRHGRVSASAQVARPLGYGIWCGNSPARLLSLSACTWTPQTPRCIATRALTTRQLPHTARQTCLSGATTSLGRVWMEGGRRSLRPNTPTALCPILRVTA